MQRDAKRYPFFYLHPNLFCLQFTDFRSSTLSTCYAGINRPLQIYRFKLFLFGFLVVQII
jgi:hypothetical protein